MKKSIVTFQIGKRGLSEGVMHNIKNAFSNRENVKISVLKSACRDREKIIEMAEKIVNELGKNYIYRIVGFTIFLKKFRKKVRK